jgi:hypothetical protein
MQDLFSVDDATNVLRRTPQLLCTMLDGLPSYLLEGREGSDTWNPREVVGHLINGERTDWIPRIRMVIAEEPGVFPPFNRTGHLTDFAGVPVPDLLRLFSQARGESVTALEGMRITAEQLDLPGRHPEFGRVTLRQLIATWVTHDYSHLSQVSRVMAKQLGDDVGPWGKYLSVLRR